MGEGREIPEVQIPSVGTQVWHDEQVYTVTDSAIHVSLEQDLMGRDRQSLDIRIRAAYQEEGYQARELL